MTSLQYAAGGQRFARDSQMSLKYAEFSALDPFFEVVQRGLSGFVDGKHYFDTIAKNAIFEFRYDIAGWPKQVESRDALMALYRGYGESIVLHGADGLVVHRCDDGRVTSSSTRSMGVSSAVVRPTRTDSSRS